MKFHHQIFLTKLDNFIQSPAKFGHMILIDFYFFKFCQNNDDLFDLGSFIFQILVFYVHFFFQKIFNLVFHAFLHRLCQSFILHSLMIIFYFFIFRFFLNFSFLNHDDNFFIYAFFNLMLIYLISLTNHQIFFLKFSLFFKRHNHYLFLFYYLLNFYVP